MPRSSLMPIVISGTGCLLVGFALGTANGVVFARYWGSNRQSGRSPSGNDQSTGSGHGAQESVRPKVVCLGDSLTQYGFEADRAGWLAQLAHWWTRRLDVVNRGFGGYNTRWLLPLIGKFFVRDATSGAAPTKLVMIFLGANDCTLPGSAQHVPILEYKNNLKTMVAHVRKVHAGARILLITPPPIHEVKWANHRLSQQAKMDRKLKVTTSYAEACVEVAAKVSVPVVNTFSAMGSGDVRLADKYLHDGVHFTSEGNRALFEAVKATIVQNFPELDPVSGAAQPMQAPHWRNVDPVNPADSVLRQL